MQGLDETDYKILEAIDSYSPITITELARIIGVSRSWAWKKVKKLEKHGLIKTEKRGKILVTKTTNSSYRALLRIGILRASEYPYIIPLAKRLTSISDKVKIIVYDEAYRLALDLAAGRVHLAMAPLVTLLALHRLSAGRVHIVGGGSSGGNGIVYSNSPTGVGHATTMTSTMELCAEVKGIPGPRMYMKSGDEILDAVIKGTVNAGIVWEPYLSRAKDLGLGIEECGLPFCCVLGANSSLQQDYHRIHKAMASSVSDAIAGRIDLDSYSALLGFDKRIVERTVGSYKFLEEPPIHDARKLLVYLRRSIVPDRVIDDAFRVGP